MKPFARFHSSGGRLPPSSESAGEQPSATAGRNLLVGILPDCLRVGSATLVCHILGLATSLLLRRLMGPAEMGVWQALKLFLGYSNYANLGISKGAARQWSVARGSGQLDSARRGLDLAFSFNTLTSLACGVVLMASAGWLAISRSGPLEQAWCVGLAALGVVVVLQRHVTFHVTVLRAGCDFRVTSRLAVLEGVLALAAGGFCTWLWGLYGLYTSTILVLLGSWWFLRASGATRFHWAWDTAVSRRLVAIGAPMVVAGALATLFRSLDKLAILWFATDAEVQLGCYSLALMVGTQLYGLANTATLVTAPRLAELYGATGCRRTVAQLAARSSLAIAIGGSIIGALAMVLAPPVLVRMFPAYAAGLAPLGWVIVGSIAWSMSLPASQFLVAVSQERRALLAIALATALAAGGDWLVMGRGGGLTALAAATAVASIAYSLWTTAISIWRALGPAERPRYLLSHALALIPALAVAGCCSTGSHVGDADCLIVSAQLLAVLGCGGAAGWLAWRIATPRAELTNACWQEFARRCNKPGYREIGNWFARRISRPAALPITWVILPTGVSAHAVTLVAWLVGVLAAGCFCFGSTASCLAGALLLELWYLLDHVDGQIARFRGTDSLDGVQLDYTMHHSLNLLVPLAVGFGLVQASDWHGWWLVGTAWGLGALLLGLEHDVRAKAMLQRLKRLHGQMQVRGGGGGRPAPASAMPRRPLAAISWCAHKACETHFVINAILLAAAVDLFARCSPLLVGSYVAAMASVSLPLALAGIVRRTASQAAEREFAAWYHPAEHSTLVRRHGDWHVVPISRAEAEQQGRVE